MNNKLVKELVVKKEVLSDRVKFLEELIIEFEAKEVSVKPLKRKINKVKVESSPIIVEPKVKRKYVKKTPIIVEIEEYKTNTNQANKVKWLLKNINPMTVNEMYKELIKRDNTLNKSTLKASLAVLVSRMYKEGILDLHSKAIVGKTFENTYKLAKK